MANKQTRKRAEDAGRSDTGVANKPAHKSARQPRRRPSRAPSIAATSDPAMVAVAAVPQAGSEKDVAATITDKPTEGADALPPPQSGPADAVMSTTSGAERPPASTKRAKLIGMLERTEGASVTEIGQRLGWLPHTVRAAITGLRHAGREVTRSRDETGKSIYRLAPVETSRR